MSQKEALPPPYSIEQLDKAKHDRSGFSCGVKDLDQYLKRYARQDLVRDLATPYVLTEMEESDIIGYYTLSNHSVNIDTFSNKVAEGLPYGQVPATLLGRLAVDQNYQEKGLGKALLFNALTRSYEGAEDIASHSVIVRAKKEDTRGFYLHYGFQAFPDNEDRLYLPVKTIQELV